MSLLIWFMDNWYIDRLRSRDYCLSTQIILVSSTISYQWYADYVRTLYQIWINCAAMLIWWLELWYFCCSNFIHWIKWLVQLTPQFWPDKYLTIGYIWQDDSKKKECIGILSWISMKENSGINFDFLLKMLNSLPIL
jgi:hypothetical protein